jgi:hypothetical protein
MASAHGAGLMVFPLLLRILPNMCVSPIPPSSHPIMDATALVLLHTSAMIAVIGAVAIVVYEYVGLAILRSAWINLDMIWPARSSPQAFCRSRSDPSLRCRVAKPLR